MWVSVVVWCLVGRIRGRGRIELKSGACYVDRYVHEKRMHALLRDVAIRIGREHVTIDHACQDTLTCSMV